jgi:hypothetical protein
MRYASAMAKRLKTNEVLPAVPSRGEPAPAELLAEIRDLIRSTRSGVAYTVNAALVILYWEVGRRIRTEVLKSERATYGEEIRSTLSNESTSTCCSITGSSGG